MISVFRNSYYMQNMWYISTTCISELTKHCTHWFYMYHQAQLMTHLRNLLNDTLQQFSKLHDTYQILWYTTNSCINSPLKHYTHLFKCIGKHTRFLKFFTNFNNSFKYQNTNPRQYRPNNNVCCFFFLFFVVFWQPLILIFRQSLCLNPSEDS